MNITKFVQLIILLFFLGFRVVSAETVKCPDVQSTINIFDATSIYKNSRVAIEKGDNVHPVTLAIYRPTAGECRREEFARYSIEGSAPTVDSLFFFKLHDEVNIFTIVSWALYPMEFFAGMGGVISVDGYGPRMLQSGKYAVLKCFP